MFLNKKFAFIKSNNLYEIIVKKYCLDTLDVQYLFHNPNIRYYFFRQLHIVFHTLIIILL